MRTTTMVILGLSAWIAVILMVSADIAAGLNYDGVYLEEEVILVEY